jgi:hypothetical protein
MDKCFYHAKTSAVTVCIGCKMPVCQTCSDEGKKGYCDACLKKTATLSARADSVRQTIARKPDAPAAPEAPTEPVAARPGGRHCLAHPDLLASAGCVTCKRPYCPACLNTHGICAPCALHSEDAKARMGQPSERSRRLAGSGVSQGASATASAGEGDDGAKRKKLIIAAVAGLVLLLGGGVAIKRMAGSSAPDAEARKAWKSAPLTAEEKAILAKLESDAKRAVPIQDAPADTGYAGGAPDTYRAPAGGYTGGAAPAAARRQPTARVRVGIASPRSGARVSGVSTVTAAVSGRPARVELYVDGEWQGAVDSPPYSFEWASHAVSNGRHRVTVEAIAEDGRKFTSGVTVTVQN